MGVEFSSGLADAQDMALRIATRLPRLVVLGLVLLLASGTLAIGAAKRLTAVPTGAPAPVAAPTIVVPDVSGQAFVFAKGTLEDTGFAWHVVGSVHGYAANKVASQTPAAGTKLKDTGAPTITLTLERTAYPEKGQPEDLSPYAGTVPQLLGAPAVRPAAPIPAKPKGAKQEPKPAAAKPKPAPAAAAPTKRPPAFSRRERAQGAAEGDPAAAACAPALGVDRRASDADARERASLPLPAHLDRHRREVRLVARGRGPS